MLAWMRKIYMIAEGIKLEGECRLITVTFDFVTMEA